MMKRAIEAMVLATLMGPALGADPDPCRMAEMLKVAKDKPEGSS